MDIATAKMFLQCLGAKQIQFSGSWVRASCPLALWRHQSGKDSRPSFGMEYKKDRYLCFSCRSHGSPMKLVMEMLHLAKDYPGIDLAKAMELLPDKDDPEGYTPAPDWNDKPEASPVNIWPEEYLSSFPKAIDIPRALEYLKSRGVGSFMTSFFDIRYDHGGDRICFPIRNQSGYLVGMRGRRIVDGSGVKFHDYSYHGKRNPHLWLNAHQVDLSLPLIIVESSFDCVAVYRHYTNVVAPLSASVSIESAKWLTAASEVILFFDNDAAGRYASQELGAYLSKFVPVSTIQYPEDMAGADPGSLPTDVLRGLLAEKVNLTK